MPASIDGLIMGTSMILKLCSFLQVRFFLRPTASIYEIALVENNAKRYPGYSKVVIFAGSRKPLMP